MTKRIPGISLNLWAGMFGLGLALWFTISYIDAILEIIWILFGALLLGIAMRPLVIRLERNHIPRSVTVLGLYAMLVAVVVLVTGLLAPVVRQELALLQADGPSLLHESVDTLSQSGLSSWFPSSDAVAASIVQRISPLVTDALDTLTKASSLVLDMFVVFVVAYFYATSSSSAIQFVLRWFPPKEQQHVAVVWDRIRYRLAHWVWAQTALAVLLAAVMGSGLFLLRVPFALTIGTVGGLFEIVPFLGGIIGLALALLSALTVNPWLALWVLVFYLAVFAVESHVLAPIIYGRAFGLRSVTVLVVLFVGMKLQGLIGVLFAVPVSVVLAVVLQEIHGPGEPSVEQSARSTPNSESEATGLAHSRAG
jgi:predicted PurR-regulated permease PerM